MAPSITPADALRTAHTGDVWLFRGRTGADRAIRLFTNAPVNHVATAPAFYQRFRERR